MVNTNNYLERTSPELLYDWKQRDFNLKYMEEQWSNFERICKEEKKYYEEKNRNESIEEPEGEIPWNKRVCGAVPDAAQVPNEPSVEESEGKAVLQGWNRVKEELRVLLVSTWKRGGMLFYIWEMCPPNIV